MIKRLAYIILVLILILIIKHLYDCSYYEFYKPSKLYDYKNVKFRTGDLLLFRWQDLNIYRKTYYSFNIKMFYEYNLQTIADRGKFTHAGIVIVIDNIPYIYEYTMKHVYKTKSIRCHYKNKYISKDYLGPYLHPISDITKYFGDVWHLSYIGPTIDEDKIFDTLKKFDKGLVYSLSSHPYCIFLNGNDENYTHCSGFISRILNDFGITNIQNTCCIVPSKLADICIKSNLYDKKIRLIHKYI